MLRALVVLAASALLSFPLHSQSAYDVVNPMVGTGAEGHTFPGAVVPFGMVQLSPDTSIHPFNHSYKWAAGYRYEDTTILGFSATHFSGAGHSDLGDFLLQPIAGDVALEPGDATTPGYRSHFSHTDEVAHPGYYAVTLDDYHVRAELTATQRVGVSRFTFPADKPAHLLLDMRSSIYNYPGKVLWSRVRVHTDGTVTGMRETRGWAPGRQLYFAMRFSAPLTGHALYDKEPEAVPYHGFKGPGTTPEDTQSIEGRGLEAVLSFGALHAPLTVAMAISPTDEAHAIANLDAEQPHLDFDATRAAARATWERTLSVIDIAADADTRSNVYTGLYHALLAPSLSMDTDGSYRGPDNQVHVAKGFDFVSSLSLWDTFRAEQPLMTILEPRERTESLMQSMLASQVESPFGILPIWQFQGIETWCMIGYHAVPELADAIGKGLNKPQAEEALHAMVASADYAPYGNIGAYLKLGYVPVDHDAEAASKTVEYAFDDWTIAETAHRLGNEDVANRFRKRAENWRNVFNTQDGFVEPKLANGQFRVPFDPARAGEASGFTEGNAWQYSWFVPQDEQGLIQTLGGDNKLIAKLDAMFDQHVDPKQYADVEDIAGMIGQYIHGNEPSHHLPYLYVYAGQPWRTQERLAQIVASQYRPTPDGLVGNDDLGQMSAWLLFTSLGFYPVTPGANQYVLGRPFVDSATLHLPNGKQFRILADHLSPQNRYVGRVLLNGKPLEKTFITQEALMAGGELRFEMQAAPEKKWGASAASRPYSMSKDGFLP
ncbi:GH92 family glycosyl hydrolase [Acidipila sp. EB88]|uniref:GH92 family glycosyl hydrolase n=1 Tax=Acidipila sp. EB88 TaxID=2305226 RepID=UPI000F5DA6EF|nr:GH92 family glycosyl hydrolase [Acidipila sp. EB88]RRA48125.1 glycoside hydrolase family 92 protein [Acidipila sp. EB88]